MRRALACAGLLLLVALSAAQTVVVGSKKFTESYVLGEIAKEVLRRAGARVEHRQGIGATSIVWDALRGGSVTAYPEYTGTLSAEILKRPGLNEAGIRRELARLGIGMTADLGFNNSYGLAMRRSEAARLGIRTISDLRRYPNLRAGITHELLARKDGWKPLVARYGLRFAETRGIEHALGYAALFAGQIDVKDVYTTDAEIAKYDLTVLRDDLRFFPQYRAVFVYRLDAPSVVPRALGALAGTIDERLMIRLNAEATKTKDYSAAARLYFASRGEGAAQVRSEGIAAKIVRLTGQHLYLVGISLGLAVLVGLPLGIWASRPGLASRAILGGTGVVQTIPSLALLALLVPLPLFGVAPQTAIAALFLYSLLPIVRNTAVGLREIPPGLRESAEALGLEPGARLRRLYIPLALPTILAGIKTAAVIDVGAATLAALIGQGGLGEPIVSGLSVNDASTILQGAIPAALLALLVEGAFDLLERAAVPKGLRLGRS